MKDKHVYVVLSRTGSFFSNIIAFFTRKEYSHVSLSLDESLCTMYSFGRKVPEFPLPGAFVEESLYDGVFAMFPDSKCCIYKIQINDFQYSMIKEQLKKFNDSKDSFSYNYMGTVAAFFNKPIKRNNKYFCSQFVSEVLKNSGVYKGEKQPEVIKPMDLLEIEEKELIYRGVIADSPHFRIYSPGDSPYSAVDSFRTLVFMFSKVKELFLSSF